MQSDGERATPDPAATFPLDDGVIALLRDLVPLYVRRASPTSGQSSAERASGALAESVPSALAFDPRLCVEIEGVVTIDAERRIAWPIGSDRPVAAALRPVGDVIEISDTAIAVGPRRPLDRRGRLRIPEAILRATNLKPGSRVLVARQPDGWVLAPASRVLIRPAP